MIDPIRQFAEQKLEHPISDADWTPAVRAVWKTLRHGEMYGVGADAFRVYRKLMTCAIAALAIVLAAPADAQVPATQFGQFRLDVVIADCTAQFGQGTPEMQQCVSNEMKRELAIMCARAKAVGATVSPADQEQCKQVGQ